MLGDAKLDRQHQELIGLVNRLYSERLEGAPRARLRKSLDALSGALLAHFGTEERMMARQRYAGFAAHKREHDGFAARIAAVRREFEAGRASIEEPLLRDLANWLRDHLIVADKPMGEALRLGRRAKLR